MVVVQNSQTYFICTCSDRYLMDECPQQHARHLCAGIADFSFLPASVVGKDVDSNLDTRLCELREFACRTNVLTCVRHRVAADTQGPNARSIMRCAFARGLQT